MLDPRIYNLIVNTPIHKVAWKLHRKLFPFPKQWMDAKGQAANDLILDILRDDKPCLIARFGKTETEAVMASIHQDVFMMPWTRVYRFLSWDLPYKGWEKIAPKLCNLSGVFPVNEETLHQFAQIYMETMPHIDLIGSWLHAEISFRDKMPSVKRVPIRDMEPYLFSNPWSQALAGQRVLIVHPFIQSITQQYEKHPLLFDDPAMLPSFDMVTVQAVQSLGGPESLPFDSWFEALDAMKREIDKQTFDVAIVGAGAYGLPLAAHIKSLGKKAVHLGGASQILFGVYGKRWEDDPKVNPLINKHWIRPLDADKIENFKQIENGCYW